MMNYTKFVVHMAQKPIYTMTAQRSKITKN